MIQIRIYYFLTLLFLVLVTPVLQSQPTSEQTTVDPRQAGFSSERLARYEDFLREEIADGKIAGAVSYIVRKGSIAHYDAFGMADREENDAMQKNKIFHLMSMTKPIISVALMMLYEEGHFLLSDPVDKYLPQFAEMQVALNPAAGMDSPTQEASRKITIEQLFTHTAGMSHGLSGTSLDNAIARAMYMAPQANIESRVNTLAGLPLVLQPGEKWSYSASPDVLALLIEKFSGQSVADFLQTRLFDPLGMDNTAYNIPTEKMDQSVAVYTHNRETGELERFPQPMPVNGHTVWGGTHGLLGTAEDYMTFCQMLLNGGAWEGRRYLSRKTLELMLTDHVGDKRADPGQGFGLGFGMTTDLAAQDMPGSVGQYYWSGAYCTYFFIDPKEELIAILMTQTSPYSGYYSNKLRQFVYQAIVD